MSDFGTPNIAEKMKRASKDEFYKKIGDLDVEAEIMNKWDSHLGYLMMWKLKGKKEVVGVSDGGTDFCESRYWLN